MREFVFPAKDQSTGRKMGMPLDLPLSAAASRWFAPVEPRLATLFYLVLLAGSSALASFAFACATPFAAFAVVVGSSLPLAPALLVMIGAWLVNQAIGFGTLDYPLDLRTGLSGLAIGLAALASTIETKLLLHSQRSRGPAALGMALFGAYAAYEVVLFAFALPLGGTGAFSFPIIVRLGLLNLLWLIGLVAACAAFRLLSSMRRRRTAF
jgi:hypothetical protein